MPGFIGLCWIITLLATCVSAGFLYLTLSSAQGAPQEAAGAAIAMAFSVIPYVFTRACQAFTSMGRQEEMVDLLRNLDARATASDTPRI